MRNYIEKLKELYGETMGSIKGNTGNHLEETLEVVWELHWEISGIRNKIMCVKLLTTMSETIGAHSIFLVIRQQTELCNVQ